MVIMQKTVSKKKRKVGKHYRMRKQSKLKKAARKKMQR